MISANNITLRVGKKALFEDVNIKFTEGNCYGLIGANGAGKSTFLKILSGQLEPTNGDVVITPGQRLSFLQQDHFKYDAYTVLDTVIMGNKRLYEIMKEKDAIYAKADFTDEDGIRASELEGEFAEMNGWEAESDAATLLNGLGIETDLHYSQMADLTGSQKVKVLLAQALFGNPDILLLDEPTNHLDLDAIAWLEEFLINFENTVIVVSHDRYFIDVVSNKIIEIENGKSHSYNCRYEEYSIQKRTQRAIDLKHYINQQKEIKKIQESIDTLKSFNREKSIKRAESKEKQLAKIERIDRPENLPSAITVQFTPAIESGYDVLKVTDLSMRYDQMVFEHCNLDIKKGERVAIVGENGVGKTTLFKALVGQLPIDHGKIRFGSHVEMAYYDQEHESLNYNKTIFDEISDCYPRMTNQEIRSTLAMFNFRGDDVFKDIAMLSGGERGRVVLTEVLLKQANFLILDEPTNHLDISSKEVLEEALKSFEGTILFISHDRYFINKIATRVIEVQKDQCLSYNGNYDDYLAQKTPVVETTQKVVTEARQRQIIDKKTKNEIKKLERTIDSLEKEINSLKEELTSEEVMNNYKKYNEITDSIDEKEMELMEIMEKWEQLQS